MDEFAPTIEDQEFCWAVAAINSRPPPRDEFQEVVVADGYFSAIRPFAMPAVRSELDVLIGFTEPIVLQGSFTEADEVDSGEIATAFQSINTLSACGRDYGARDLGLIDTRGALRRARTGVGRDTERTLCVGGRRASCRIQDTSDHGR